ncbi:MAG: hypothetical protein JSW50_02480 [Candidatus Latescibacterota bacterium]|nr:MAG: hypothetical protein JSW50_02480 [Candidatus Latescibacterota bacterium]
MPSTKTNTIEQYCSVCKDQFDMEVVKQGSSKGVIWLKCPGCQGYLPYMPEENEETEDSAGGDAANPELALEDLDIENAREYSESDTYEVGEIVHHRSWNDYGKVLSKDELPGNRKTVWVQFLRQGKIQLLEGVE